MPGPGAGAAASAGATSPGTIRVASRALNVRPGSAHALAGLYASASTSRLAVMGGVGAGGSMWPMSGLEEYSSNQRGRASAIAAMQPGGSSTYDGDSGSASTSHQTAHGAPVADVHPNAHAADDVGGEGNSDYDSGSDDDEDDTGGDHGGGGSGEGGPPSSPPPGSSRQLSGSITPRGMGSKSRLGSSGAVGGAGSGQGLALGGGGLSEYLSSISDAKDAELEF